MRRLIVLLLGALAASLVACTPSPAAPANSPEEVFDQTLEEQFGYKSVEVEREIEGRVEVLEATTTIDNCTVELEFVLGRLEFSLGELHLTTRQGRGLKKDKLEPDWPNQEVRGGPDNINPTRDEVAKLLKQPPSSISAMVKRCVGRR